MMICLLLAVTSLRLFFFVSPASQTTYEEARKLYYQGAEGDPSAYEDASKLFLQLYKSEPDSARVAVYYGSLRLLEASRSWAVWKKNSLSKEGLLLMDQAVRKAPNDLEVRFVRAATTRELPSFFDRRQQSDEDFAFVASHLDNHKLEPRLASASLYYYGLSLKEKGRREAAVMAWRRAIEVAPDSRAARESKDALKTAFDG
jgi:tetratricopeptide (TPR) repeat protein